MDETYWSLYKTASSIKPIERELPFKCTEVAILHRVRWRKQARMITKGTRTSNVRGRIKVDHHIPSPLQPIPIPCLEKRNECPRREKKSCGCPRYHGKVC